MRDKKITKVYIMTNFLPGATLKVLRLSVVPFVWIMIWCGGKVSPRFPWKLHPQKRHWNTEHDEEFWRILEMESIPFCFFYKARLVFFFLGGVILGMKILHLYDRLLCFRGRFMLDIPWEKPVKMVDRNWEIHHWYPLVPSPTKGD